MPMPRLAAAALMSSLLATTGAWAADAAPLAIHEVTTRAASGQSSVDGVVEAVRDTVVSAQVQGAVVVLGVKAGDAVKAGQELVRIDARAASQNAAASSAQVEAARAGLQVASKEFERQKQLFQKQYISQAALDRAQAQLQASQAQVRALQAQAGAAATQSGFYALKAPYSGVVSEVAVALGDMAMPGKPLVRMYDPTALRVTAMVPQMAASALADAKALQAEIPGLASERITVPAEQAQLLPTVDAATHTLQLRLALPGELKGVTPGMFARVWLPASAGAAGAQSVRIPAAALVRRAEMTGVYVLSAEGRPLLRQVRVGRRDGDQIEVLSGLRQGDKVATAPQAAAKVR
ncbi:efflux transporter, RND family, MFP subunit [Acidovorax delafieldii 2AN]|uniref:Efflux transporter, RND family, MFP subunit n=1 Tax=Acidovorax delafieldii 2AN TaxID=573060 RepID=C5T5N4_ACIDE|nr:efflux RND transporter periplasmic adaptor subunit [Acidovorax delafieldii]EER60207.1 efflux transporter, RND family, MFP subunit [Acidovorax delafieldii 2AN]